MKEKEQGGKEKRREMSNKGKLERGQSERKEEIRKRVRKRLQEEK